VSRREALAAAPDSPEADREDAMRARFAVATLLVAAPAFSQTLPPPPPPPPPAAAAHATPRPRAEVALELLERLQQVFDRMSVAEERELADELSSLAHAGRACLHSDVFDREFHARYARLLRVLRLVLITDTGDILADIVNRELIAFVKDVTGRTYDPAAGASEQIVLFSDAVASELAALHARARRLE
jgi:hypothetical protein